MISDCQKKSFVRKLIGVGTSIGVSLTLTGNVFAQSATDSSSLSKGGSSSALPSAGSAEITYAIFAFGVLLFVFGTLKLVKSFQD